MTLTALWMHTVKKNNNNYRKENSATVIFSCSSSTTSPRQYQSLASPIMMLDKHRHDLII
jgi:hypothetical protein